MLAIAWPDQPHPLSTRLASSLCAGIGGNAGTASIHGIDFAYRALRWSASQSRSWRPATLPDGRIAVFHGHFDNSAAIAAELRTKAGDLARLYALAVQHWGDDADRRIVGDYCAVIAEAECGRVRLSRSPLRGPPLYYSHDAQLIAVSSVPRALFTAGVEQRLNEVRLADGAVRNFMDQEATWFEGVSQVPVGTIVELERLKPRVLRRYYDILDIPMQVVGTDDEVVARVGELLDEGVRACIAGFDRPGSTLSGGLDSPQVAVRALAALPPGQKLPTFTFHPEEEFDGRVPQWMMGDERPFVEQLAKMHQGLDPHFTANRGYAPDHRWRELFHLIGSAPSYLGTFYSFHGVLESAVKQHCDVLLLAEWGNLTFSDKGECAFIEYFLTGRWRQWWLALTRPQIHEGGILRRIVARTLSGLLPDALWRPLRRVALPRNKPASDLVQPLSREYRRTSGVDRRARKAGLVIDRYQPWSRRDSRKQLIANEGWQAEVYQGFEQLYGVPLRDPTAYRPLVEYCLALPTRFFLRDGDMRWLAKRLAIGIMPEEQRVNPLSGWWDADWHVRIGRKRAEYLEELDRIDEDAQLSKMFDVPRLRAALTDWSEQTETDYQKFFTPMLAVPAALLTARFVKYVEGQNY